MISIKHTESSFKTDDGIIIYSQHWEPEEPCKGVICLVHGLGEHSGRYAHLAAFLNQHKFALCAFDLRGHGKSTGQRGYCPHFESFLTDIKKFILIQTERYPGLPVFLYGHSLGGTLALNYTFRNNGNLAGMIATGPYLAAAFQPPSWKISLGKLMMKIKPSFTMSNEIDPMALSRDPRIAQDYRSDPLVHDRVTAPLAFGMFDAGDWLIQHAVEIPLPILLMQGSADRLVSPAGSIEFAKRAGERCTLKMWQDFFHEIHNEPEQAEVFNYLLGWLEERLNNG